MSIRSQLINKQERLISIVIVLGVLKEKLNAYFIDLLNRVDMYFSEIFSYTYVEKSIPTIEF